MSAEGNATAPTSAPPSGTGAERTDNRPRGQRGGRGGGGGRGQSGGRGRGGHGRGGSSDNQNGGGGGGQRRGDGRSQRGNRTSVQSEVERLTTDKSKLGVKPQNANDKEGEEDGDAEVCFICAGDIVYISVGPCNHRTCHICGLRMRALYKDINCTHCRTPAETVVFTDNATKLYQDFTEQNIHKTDAALGIRYEKQEILEDTVILLRYNCPDPECDTACLGWPDLHRHVKAVHGKIICDLCSKHKKVFTHEHELLTAKELQQHMRKGDDNPGAIDQSGFKGHPLCSFCGTRFYGDDELYVHCRDSHERCHICERVNGGQPVYFLNPDALAEHHRKAPNHFPCPDPECVRSKVIVYDTLMDLKAHQLEQHGSTLDKDSRRDARAVDISNFDYRSEYRPERRGGGAGQSSRGDRRSGGRGRDPNAEPLPASSAQPLGRAEQAYQRQMAIHSAQSTTARTFGGSLTAAPAPPPSATRNPAPQAQTIPPPSNSAQNVATGIANLDINEAAQTPQERARAIRHNSVIERANVLLQKDTNKMTRFRTFISNYKSGSITAKALIDSFFALFTDTSSTALGTLIQEVADLFEDRQKAANIRTAWNDWRAINEDYPSLPGPSGIGGSTNLPGMGWASITSAANNPSSSNTAPTRAKTSRVLKLKSSTAQSSRSSVSQTGSWGGSLSIPLSTPASSSNNFPALTPANPQPNSSKITTTPWVPTPVNSQPSSARPTPPTSRPASRATRGGAAGGAEFPSLPPASKPPPPSLFGFGGRGAAVRRDGWGNTAPVNAHVWGQSSASANDNDKGGEDEGESAAGGKKGKKGKKVLVAWG